MADADFIRYTLNDAPALTGIHAALGIEEASLIAVPDAIHRGWHSVGRLRRCRRPFPQRRGHIRRGGIFWNATRPNRRPRLRASPIADISCDVICALFEAPSLLVEGPDAAGAFTLEWIEHGH